MPFNISVSNKDAKVALLSGKAKPSPSKVSSTGEPLSSLKILTQCNLPSVDNMSEIIEYDKELDLQKVGRILDNTSYVFTNNNKPANSVKILVTQHNPVTGETQTKELSSKKPNICIDNTPVQVLKRVPKGAFLTKFVIKNSFQLGHTDGLTYDFLFELAQSLHETGEVALLGAGSKGAPLVFREGGKAYRCALSGKVNSDGSYLLLVHLLGQELKKPS